MRRAAAGRRRRHGLAAQKTRWGCRRTRSPTWPSLACAHAEPVARLACLDELAGHVPDKHSAIHLGKALDGVDQTVAPDHSSLIITRVADAANDAKQI